MEERIKAIEDRNEQARANLKVFKVEPFESDPCLENVSMHSNMLTIAMTSGVQRFQFIEGEPHEMLKKRLCKFAENLHVPF